MIRSNINAEKQMCLIEMKRVKFADLMPLQPAMTKAKVKRYEKKMRAGANFPPCVVVKWRGQCWLEDGSHRSHAWARLGRKSINAAVFYPESDDEANMIGELAYALSDAGVTWPVALKAMRTMLGIHFPAAAAQSA